MGEAIIASAGIEADISYVPILKSPANVFHQRQIPITLIGNRIFQLLGLLLNEFQDYPKIFIPGGENSTVIFFAYSSVNI